MQGPTISPVFTPANGGGAAAEHGFYAAVICVPKKKLYASVKALRKVLMLRVLNLQGFPPQSRCKGVIRHVVLKLPGMLFKPVMWLHVLVLCRRTCACVTYLVAGVDESPILSSNLSLALARHCAPPWLQLGGSGVMVQPMTYIFDEEPARWRNIAEELALPDSVTASMG